MNLFVKRSCECKHAKSPAKSSGFITSDINLEDAGYDTLKSSIFRCDCTKFCKNCLCSVFIQTHPEKSSLFLPVSKSEKNPNTKNTSNSNQENTVNFQDSNHAENLMSCFDDLRKKSLFTDVILDVASHEFPAHRVVLVSGSDYFKQMFCTDHRASKQMMIQITGLSADVMEMLLSYLYTSKINITKENVKLLLQATDLFKVNTLKNACIQFLLKNLTLSNALSTLSHAEAHNYKELAEKSRSLLEENFENFVKSDDFLKASRSQVIKLLKNDKIQVKNEELVYEAALSWLMP